MAEEMLRVTKPGGLMVLSYTLWWGPFGGHETGPWHALGGEYAAKRYLRKTGREPKNRFGVSLFKVGATDGLRWARGTSRARCSPRSRATTRRGRGGWSESPVCGSSW